MIMMLLISIMLSYIGYSIIELRSLLFAQATLVDLEQERVKRYATQGILLYGVALYKMHRTVWELPQTVTYTDSHGEYTVLEFSRHTKHQVLVRIIQGTNQGMNSAHCVITSIQEKEDMRFKIEFKGFE